MTLTTFLRAVLLALAFCGPSVTLAETSPPPLSVYGQLPGFEMASISSSGDHVAIIGTVSGTRRLLIFDAANKLIRTAKVNNVKVRGVEWAGDQAVLVHYSATVGLGVDFTTSKAT